MPFALETAPDGRRIRLKEQPLLLKVTRGDQPGGEISLSLQAGQPFLDNRSSAVCLVNGSERAACHLQPGDQLQLGTHLFKLVELTEQPPSHPAVTPADPADSQPSSAPPPSADSDRQRQQRRISASRMTSVGAQPAASSGLLRLVSSAFGGRAEKQRLEQLETERRAALINAGRRSLSDGSALGLPAQVMMHLQRGQAVTLRAQDLDGLGRWREERQSLARLDAEIAALRQSLSMGADPDAVVLTTPTLRSTEQAKDERAFATMDAVGTQMIDSPEPSPAPPVVRPAGRKRR